MRRQTWRRLSGLILMALAVMGAVFQAVRASTQDTAPYYPLLQGRSAHQVAQAETSAVGCFPGTGTPPATSPYPARAYLPLLVSPGGDCLGGEAEMNDTHSQATPFTQGCYHGAATGSGDLDWYQINLCATVTALQVNLVGPAGADLDLYLYGNPPGLPLKASEGAGSQEAFTATGLVTGTYFVLVSPVSGDGAYVLTGQVQR